MSDLAVKAAAQFFESGDLLKRTPVTGQNSSKHSWLICSNKNGMTGALESARQTANIRDAKAADLP